jgi:CubicO group peptidase (beta-lactamase class C family)
VTSQPETLPRSTPAEQGVDAAGIDALVAALAPLAGVELHSLMIVRHGQVVAEGWWEPYRATDPHLLYSLSKSFASTAIGLAVAEGLVDLDATVLSYFPEFDERVTDERSRRTRVRHVAAMASGHEDDTLERAHAAGAGDLVLGLLLTPPEREPGTIFAYNQPCTYTLGQIVARVSGGTLTEFLRTRLFEPLGISPYGWQTTHTGREQGFSGLHVTTEAIAKLGLLYLNEGQWNGKQLLTPEWVAEATRSHIATNRPAPDWDQGYGFQFWRSRHGYRGDGAYGQFMLVLPEADAVVAMTAQSPEMQPMLDAVWTHLLPALSASARPGGSWPAAPLSLPRPVPSGPAGEIVPAAYRPGPGNELASLRRVELRADEIVLTDSGPELTVTLGEPHAWTRTGPTLSAYAWKEGLLLVDLVFVETPHRLHLTLDPAAKEFTARWQAEPLGRLPLAWMHMPAVAGS